VHTKIARHWLTEFSIFSAFSRLGGHPQQMPQSMSTGSNTIGHGGIDRGGVGLPMGAGTMPGGVGGGGQVGVPGGPQVGVGPPGSGNGEYELFGRDLNLVLNWSIEKSYLK